MAYEHWKTWPSDEWYREQARFLYDDGTVDIDENGVVTRSPDGAFIACWVWVDIPVDDDKDEEPDT